MKNKAFLFDRDGTLIKDKNYICEFSEVEIYSYSFEALKITEKKGFISIGITNQSSIARGICKEEQVRKIHNSLMSIFKKKNIDIVKIYYCPFHENAIISEYKKNAPCRKPAPGMILEAAQEFNLDLSKSYMVGDSTRDIIAGINAGCKTALVMTGNGKKAIKELETLNIKPDLIAKNIFEIAKLV